jgi:ABC-type antimicrobial peptide transport system permease subunit
MLWMVLRQALALGAIGIAIGIAGSLGFAQYARTLLYQIDATDPTSLTAAAAIMLAVALVAGVLPARRAARVDPLVALRSE